MIEIIHYTKTISPFYTHAHELWGRVGDGEERALVSISLMIANRSRSAPGVKREAIFGMRGETGYSDGFRGGVHDEHD
jgi:hypothetical protein